MTYTSKSAVRSFGLATLFSLSTLTNPHDLHAKDLGLKFEGRTLVASEDIQPTTLAGLVSSYPNLEALIEIGVNSQQRLTRHQAEIFTGIPGDAIRSLQTGITIRTNDGKWHLIIVDDDLMVGPGTGSPRNPPLPIPVPVLQRHSSDVPGDVAAPPWSLNETTTNSRAPSSLSSVDSLAPKSATPAATNDGAARAEQETCSIDAAEGRLPCAVFSVMFLTNGTTCSGTTISERHILTAAHCVCHISNRGPEPLKHVIVVMGDSFLKTPGGPEANYLPLALDESAGVNLFNTSTATVKDAVNFCDSRTADEGDLAILTLEQDAFARYEDVLANHKHWGQRYDRRFVDVGDFETAELPFDENTPPDAANVLATGAGRDPYNSANWRQIVKHVADMRISPGLPWRANEVDGFRVGGRDVSFCQGDSGGGVFRPISGSRKTGRDSVALIGVVTAVGDSSTCEYIEDQPFPARSIVSLGNASVRDWITRATDGEVEFSDLMDSWPQIVVANTKK